MKTFGVCGVYLQSMKHTPMTLDPLESRRLFAATLTAGVSVTTGIRTAGVQKNYSINLTAGQTFVVAAGDNSSGFSTELIFISPAGKALRRSSGADGAFIGTVASVTGTYRVRVRDVSNTHTGSVTLTAFFTGASTITDSDDGGTVDSGRRFAASIGPGDLDVWTIPATKGQFIGTVVNENDNGASIGVGVLLVAPDGTAVLSKENAEGFVADTTATQTGTYYDVVYEPGANATGRYGICVAQAPGTQATEDADTNTPLTSGTPRNGDLPSGDQDVFQVSIGRGKTASVAVHASSGSTVTPAMELIDPNGKEVHVSTATAGATSDQLTYTTTISGTYSIVLRNSLPDTGGDYQLTYTLS